MKSNFKVYHIFFRIFTASGLISMVIIPANHLKDFFLSLGFAATLLVSATNETCHEKTHYTCYCYYDEDAVEPAPPHSLMLYNMSRVV